MRKFIVAAILVTISYPASAYDLKNLSAQDLLTIGKGLDKLPREETSSPDGKGLFERVQAQITEQENSAKKASADATAKAVADYRANLAFELLNERGWPRISRDGD